MYYIFIYLLYIFIYYIIIHEYIIQNVHNYRFFNSFLQIMDVKEPKTRQETKGKGKKKCDTIYNQKTVRLKEAVMQKQTKYNNNNKMGK